MDHQETSESQADDAALVECLDCAKKIGLSEFHTHENNCEGGSSGVSASISTDCVSVRDDDDSVTNFSNREMQGYSGVPNIPLRAGGTVTISNDSTTSGSSSFAQSNFKATQRTSSQDSFCCSDGANTSGSQTTSLSNSGKHV